MSTTVVKSIDPVIDVGNLLAIDLQPLDTARLSDEREEYLRSVTRDNIQMLVNEVWKLPAERAEDAIVVALPPATTTRPREKPVPKPKPLTKWEKYAKQKGIVKRKRTKMVWDEDKKEYRPRFGYKRVNDEKDVWALPVPEQGDQMEDQFEKRSNAKKERVAKNELQRLRNIARSQKGGLKAVRKTIEKDATAEHQERKQKVDRKLAIARASTASMGAFDKEPVMKRKGGNRTGQGKPVLSKASKAGKGKYQHAAKGGKAAKPAKKGKGIKAAKKGKR